MEVKITGDLEQGGNKDVKMTGRAGGDAVVFWEETEGHTTLSQVETYNILKRNAGNVIVDTQSKTALACFSASNGPTGATLLP